MVTPDDSEWPLPSQDARVRRLFYFAEGMSIGAGVSALVLFLSFVVILFLASGAYTEITILEALLYVIGLVLIARFTLIGLVSIDRTTSEYHPPEYQDWQEIRQWKWVTAVAIISSLILFSASVTLWGWKIGGLLYSPIVMIGATIVGLSLYAYFCYKIGFNIISAETE